MVALIPEDFRLGDPCSDHQRRAAEQQATQNDVHQVDTSKKDDAT
ncbi:MAG: hypothetical protein WA622_18060 [Mycobacterium sp.]